jgi:hypothetical protein
MLLKDRTFSILKIPMLYKNLIRLLSLLLLLNLCACQSNNRKGASGKPIPSDTIAYERFRFGMTENEFDKLGKDSITIINDRLYTLSGSFLPSNNHMFELFITSGSLGYDDIQTEGVKDINALVQQMTALYGDPTRWFQTPVNDKYQPHIVQWRCEWELYNKQIRVGLYQPDEDRRYKAVCRIVNKTLKVQANHEVIEYGIPVSIGD